MVSHLQFQHFWGAISTTFLTETLLRPSLEQDETLGSDSIFQFIWRDLPDLGIGLLVPVSWDFQLQKKLE